ncbi:MAG: DEAD/DEAH box helicase family protein [Bacteroidales bacterium]|nr:DEAD/DEAH box helicase family protein [Bacteroidales bacterium]
MATKEEIHSELQNQALDEMITNKRLILEWATGVGKSRVGIKLVDFLDLFENKTKVLLLVGEDAHKENWKTEFIEALGEKRATELLANVRMECYASLKKCLNFPWDLVIADEGHHLRSPKKVEMLHSLKTERFLILSATLSDHGDAKALKEALVENFGEFVNKNYNLDNAIEDGILPEPNIEVLPLQMWDKAENRYDDITNYLDKKKKEYLSAMNDTGFFAKSEAELEGLKAKMLHAGSMRKQFLGRLKSNMAKRIIDEYNESNLRYICFCASIDQVEKLGGTNVINSRQSRKINKETIRRFNDGEIDSLFAVGMLQEGVSLKNIQAGLIVQLDGKSRSFVQKFGRVLRSKKPILKIIYVPESRDEDFLYNALKDVNQKYVHGWDINEYITKFGMFEIQNISTETLVGPMPSYNRIRQAGYQAYPVEAHKGRFVANVNGQETMLSSRLSGIFGGVFVHTPKDEIYLNIYHPQHKTLFALRISVRNAIGFLMPLCTARMTHHTNIEINLVQDGMFFKPEIRVRGILLNWAKMEIPKISNPDDNGIRLNFINNLIQQTCLHYTEEIMTKNDDKTNGQHPAATPIQQSAVQPTTPVLPPPPAAPNAYANYGQRFIQNNS